MIKDRKKILIKSTSSVGSSMVSNAEYHTLFYFSKWLSVDSDIFVSGIEYQSSLIEELEDLKVVVRKPFINYISLKNLKIFFHIPVSILNTFIDAYKTKPDLLICLGGVFYNGLAIIITGKILGIRTLVRSAEDHIAIAKYKRSFRLSSIYASFIALISSYVIKNSDYFLTVGEWSHGYFKNTYKLNAKRSFMIPGPIDNAICKKNEFKKNKDQSREVCLKIFGIAKKDKIILFIGSEGYKGIFSVIELAKKIKNQNLDVQILWITNSIKIEKKIYLLKLDNFIRIIKPVKRDKLVTLLKAADYLFWSTTLGVGYGQIMLESILCGTEILCYSPVGDAKILVKESYYSNLDEVIKRIRNKIPPRNIEIPEWMNQEFLENQHQKVFRYILSKTKF